MLKWCINTQLGGALGGISINGNAPVKPGNPDLPPSLPTDLATTMRATTTPPHLPAYRGHLPKHLARSQAAPGCRMSRPNLAMSTYLPQCTHLCGRTTHLPTHRTPYTCRINSTKSHMDRCANTYLGGRVPRHNPSHGLPWFEHWPGARPGHGRGHIAASCPGQCLPAQACLCARPCMHRQVVQVG